MRIAEVVGRMASWKTKQKAVHDLADAEVEVARWLRGDAIRYETLRKWILSRVEGRGSAPPSNPHDTTVRAGQDWECRQIASRLEAMVAAPAILDSEPETE